MSTVLDVGLACLLITTSALVLVVAPTQPTPPPAADRAGRALLASTITLAPDGHPVETSVADALTVAATNDGSGEGDALPTATRAAILNVTRDIGPRITVSATHSEHSHQVTIGPRPTPGSSVDAAVFRVNDGASGSDEPVVITVRTWST